MVRVNQFIALGAVLALTLLTTHTAFAGPAGSSGDSLTVAGSVEGGLRTNLWTTDPNGGGLNLGEYTYQLFGPEDADYRLCGTFNEVDGESPVAVKINSSGEYFIWHVKDSGGPGGIAVITFGNPATDTPTIMDVNGDGFDNPVVVRDAGGALQWITYDNVAESFLFGPAGSAPVPGNWDAQSAGDEAAVTTAGTEGSGKKLWRWQDDSIQSGVGSAILGDPTDRDVAYTDGGVTRPGAARVQTISTPDGDKDVNVYRIRIADDLTETIVFGDANTSAPVGSCNL